MSGIYYVELADLLSSAGLRVGVNDQNRGWETRARSSGGFPSPPLCVFWHHTASQTSIENDLAWQCHGCDDAPVGNMTIDREGTVWPVAAGASNCAGKGGPATFSRGTIPADSGNTRGFNIEVANNGVGEAWPVAQIDSYFLTSNTLNAYVGNQPDDVISHALGTGNGWTDRKIDPAKSGSVQGPWRPGGCNGSSDTWVLDDIRAECRRRAGDPGPIPPLPGGQTMNHPVLVWRDENSLDVYCIGENNGCWRMGFTFRDGWGKWEDLGGVFSGDISVAIQGPDRVDLMGRGQANGPLFQRTFENGAWSPDWVAIANWPG